jgi:hypothetical protein
MLSLIVALCAAVFLGSRADLRVGIDFSVAVLVGWGLAIVFLKPCFSTPTGLLAATVLVRWPLLWAPPSLSDDLYRYLWEGQVWRAGLNPFLYAPDAPELVHLRDAIWEKVNHRHVSSIYPPLAQLSFATLSPLGVYGWKCAMGLADVGTALLLFRRRPEAGSLWALLPLPALEAAGSGHLEGLGVMWMVAGLSLGRGFWGASLLWAAAMVKLLPALLLPRVAPRWSWPLWGVATLGAFWAMGLDPALFRGFETYRQHWSFNGSLYPLLRFWVEEEAVVRLLLQATGLGVVAGIVWRSQDPGRIALWSCGAFVLLSPTVHPWYVLWVLAAGLWCAVDAWLLLGTLVPLAYLVWGPQGWSEPPWVAPVIYTPVYLRLLWTGLRRLVLPSPFPVF